MAGGQALLAFAPALPLVFAARILVGVGDAMTFVSVLRLLPNWFGGRILPQLAQWVGMLGQLGQILATVPFALLLHAPDGSPRSSSRAASRCSAEPSPWPSCARASRRRRRAPSRPAVRCATSSQRRDDREPSSDSGRICSEGRRRP
jgi:hypothetical protein